MADFNLALSDAAVAEMNGAVAALAAVAKVENDAEARKADAAVKQAKTLVKVVHDERMAITRRIDAAKKQVMNREAEICADINAELQRVQLICNEYVTAQEAAKVEANARAEVMGEATDDRKAVAGVGARQYWGFKILDPLAVPRAYCKPDEVAIRAYLDNARRNGADIAALHMDGVEFYKEFRV